MRALSLPGVLVLVAMLVLPAGLVALRSPDAARDDSTAPHLAPSSGGVAWGSTDVRVSDPATLFPGDIQDLFEPSIAIDPTNPDHVLAFGIDFSTQNYDPNVWSADRSYRSTDGGSSWTDLGPMAPPDWDGGDPVVLFAPDGTAYYSELAKLVDQGERVGGILVYRMLPGAATWEEPVVAVSRAAVDNDCPSPDKEWLSRGDDGTLYLVWTDFVYHCDVPLDDPFVSSQSYKHGSIKLITSSDNGATWSQPLTVFDHFAIGAIALPTPDGTLHVAHWAGATLAEPGSCPGIRITAASLFYKDPRPLGTLVVSSSSDGGASWTHHKEPVCTHDADFLTKAGSFQAGANPTIDRDPVTGRVYVIYPHFLLHEHRSTLMMITSADDGGSWSEPLEITAGRSDDAWLPTLELGDDGTLHLAYVATDALTDTGGVVYRASTDRGATWSAPLWLSTEPWQLEEDPALGHYIEMDVAAGRIAVAWTDARNGSPTEIWARMGTLGGSP